LRSNKLLEDFERKRIETRDGKKIRDLRKIN